MSGRRKPTLVCSFSAEEVKLFDELCQSLLRGEDVHARGEGPYRAPLESVAKKFVQLRAKARGGL